MTEINWTKAGQPNPDPARVQKDHITSEMSDRDIVNFRKGLKKKNSAKPRPSPRVSLEEALDGRRDSEITDWKKRRRIVERSGKPDADRFIHLTAMMALAHAQQHGDCKRALSLVLAMPASSRRDRLARWFAAHSRIQIDVARRSAWMAKEGSVHCRKFDLEGAQRQPFYELR